MTYLDHDLGPDGANRAPARPVTTQRTPASAPSAPLLDLQRLAGNSAVNQAIQTGRLGSDLTVQRLDEEAEEESPEESPESEDESEQEMEVLDAEDEMSEAAEEESESESESEYEYEEE